MTKTVCITVALFALAACGETHDTDDSGGSVPAVDGGAHVPVEAYYPPYDSGIRVPIPDGGFRDAGVHPAADVGPPGDGTGDTWTGYIEAFMFPSGSDDVRIVFDSDHTDGTVYFGMGTPPPPATDPNVGYPPGYGYDRGVFGDYVVEGFGYRFTGAMVSASRVQITVDLGTLWAEWCSRQYPLMVGPDFYQCGGNTGFTSSADGCSYPDPMTGQDVPVDCGRLFLCGAMGGSACACTATDCTAATGNQVTFDFHVTGNDGTGTIGIGAPHNVYLTR